ncbi:MAG: nitroreductase family protein [Gaiellales bacterium]
MDALEALSTRTSPAALTEPAPDSATMERLLHAAMRAPDHGRLRPWRFIIIDGDARQAFGAILAEALRAREPSTAESVLDRERAKPLRAPRIVVVAAELRERRGVPEIEQVIAAGAAAQNLLVAAHASGYGGFWRTGQAAYDDTVKHALGLASKDAIVGFIYLGTPTGVGPLPAGDGVTRVIRWSGPRWSGTQTESDSGR